MTIDGWVVVAIWAVAMSVVLFAWAVLRDFNSRR